ncbi:MAG: DUF4303 domain-containing protein [Filimonas sp.]|nr:DUF4303 domain-containing protein [Filimonas sp.]
MNFEILKQKIEAAARKAFIEMYDQHNAEGIYAFALYSDEGAMTVCPSTNTLKHLESADKEDLDYYKFEPAEWKYEMQGADDDFNSICDELREELDKNEDNDEWFKDFQKRLYDTCIEVLEKLKQENFFRNITGKDIYLTFTASEYEFSNKQSKDIVTRLNDNEYRTEYLNWMKSWGR